MQLENERILLAVSGGISLYKSLELVRRLTKAGATVKVAMTEAATNLINPACFEALSGGPVFSPQYEPGMAHIDLAHWASAIVVAPATANTIGKLAGGIADNLVTTTIMASDKPVLIAPAMNKTMWFQPAVQRNIEFLSKTGYVIIGPGEGEQACGDVGEGRMAEVDEITAAIETFHDNLRGLLRGRRVLVTAGPTREFMDPVRFLSNRSSGKMGFALARAAQMAAAEVTLVSGPAALATPLGVKRIDVVSASEMASVVLREAAHHDLVICAAAVADWSVQTVSEQKMRKTDAAAQLKLVESQDILATLGVMPKPPFLVGFAADTGDDALARAKEKLHEKRAAMILANRVDVAGQGFDVDQNALTLLVKDEIIEFPKQSKHCLAGKLISVIADKFNEENSSKNSR